LQTIGDTTTEKKDRNESSQPKKLAELIWIRIGYEILIWAPWNKNCFTQI